MTAREVLAEFILRARGATGKTQDQLGREVGVLGGTISRWEGARSIPESRTLRRLAEALEVDPTKLYELHSRASEENARNLKRDVNKVASQVEAMHRTLATVHSGLSELTQLFVQWTERQHPGAS